jgi:hypothetical protein
MGFVLFSARLFDPCGNIIVNILRPKPDLASDLNVADLPLVAQAQHIAFKNLKLFSDLGSC